MEGCRLSLLACLFSPPKHLFPVETFFVQYYIFRDSLCLDSALLRGCYLDNEFRQGRFGLSGGFYVCQSV